MPYKFLLWDGYMEEQYFNTGCSFWGAGFRVRFL